MSARRVCDLLNIGETTFFRWVRLGQGDEKLGKKHSRFMEFMETMRRAEAEFDLDHLKAVAVNPDWRVRAWLLERRRPDDFGPKERPSGELDKPRHGIIVEAEVNPVHTILDEAKRQGPNWLLLAPEKLSEILVGASRKASGLSGNDRATLRL